MAAMIHCSRQSREPNTAKLPAQLGVARAGVARVKRVLYPPGFRWSTHMKAVVGTDYCLHAHVGFLARGRVHIQYADGCSLDFAAPQVLAVEPMHDAWVVGDE